MSRHRAIELDAFLIDQPRIAIVADLYVIEELLGHVAERD